MGEGTRSAFTYTGLNLSPAPTLHLYQGTGAKGNPGKLQAEL